MRDFWVGVLLGFVFMGGPFVVWGIIRDELEHRKWMSENAPVHPRDIRRRSTYKEPR